MPGSNLAVEKLSQAVRELDMTGGQIQERLAKAATSCRLGHRICPMMRCVACSLESRTTSHSLSRKATKIGLLALFERLMRRTLTLSPPASSNCIAAFTEGRPRIQPVGTQAAKNRPARQGHASHS